MKFDAMIAEGLAKREAGAANTAVEGAGGALFSTEGKTDNERMNEEEIKSYFREECKKTKETVDRVEYTKENYLNLFGEEEKAETVLGTVLISRNQFQKLQDRNRTGYLGAMSQTLKTPDIIIKDGDNSWLYVKTFKKTTTDGCKTFIGVVVQKGSKKYLVSLHQKDLNNVLNKIKKVGDIIYPDRTKASGITQSLDSLSTYPGEKSSPDSSPEEHIPSPVPYTGEEIEAIVREDRIKAELREISGGPENADRKAKLERALSMIDTYSIMERHIPAESRNDTGWRDRDRQRVLRLWEEAGKEVERETAAMRKAADEASGALFSLEEEADNEGMDAEQAQKYREFVKDAWENAINHREGEAIPDEEFLLFVDKDGYRHTTTSQRIRHIVLLPRKHQFKICDKCVDHWDHAHPLGNLDAIRGRQRRTPQLRKGLEGRGHRRWPSAAQAAEPPQSPVFGAAENAPK